MAPRSAQSFSTASSSLFTEDVPPSIDVMSLDDPAKMSPRAIQAELKYYGVEMSLNNSKAELEKALMFHRRKSTSGGSSRNKGSGGGRGGSGSGGGRGTSSSPVEQQSYEPQRPGTTPQHHLQATAAKVPGMRVTTPPNSSSHAPQSYNSTKYTNGSAGNNPTHIPLTPNNRIPPQILNIIRISADSTMKAINLDHRNLGDKEVIKLVEAMERNRTVTFLSLRNCAISDTACKKIGNMLLRNTTLVELHLDQNQIGTEGAATLSTSLITNEKLAVLTLNENENLGDKGVTYLIGALEHNITLRTLDVHHCGMSSGNEKRRLEQIESMLEDRQIDSNFESLLERLLDDDFRVTGIDLSGRRIGDKGAARLADALNDNTQVRQLWLRGCNIGNAGAASLASCLEQNMAIVDLFLGNNSIGNEGLVAISDALALSNLTLVSLELDDNQVSEGGLDAFSRALEKNTSVLVASFENNPIGNSGKIAMLQAKLAEKRNGLNLVSFVVDPDAGTEGGSGVDGNSGLINMSVCSSYMPSTYRRAGITSQVGGMRESGGQSDLREAARGATDRGHGKSSSSVQFSVYSRSRPPPPPKQPQQSSPRSPKSDKSPPLIVVPVSGESSPPPKSLRSSRGSSSHKSKSSHPSRSSSQQPSKSSMPSKSSRNNAQSVSNNSRQIQADPKQQPRSKSSSSKSKQIQPRAGSPPPSRSKMYERAHVPVPLKAQALAPITEQSVDTRSNSGDVSSKISSERLDPSRSQSMSQAQRQQQNNTDMAPLISKVEEGEAELNVKKSKEPTVVTETEDTTITKSERADNALMVNLQHPQTQRNFNETLVKLWRRVEMMKRTNHFAAAHYKARHFWLWFVPISTSMCMSVILCLAMALTPNARVGLALATGFFSCLALAMNFLQSRFGWSSRAQVHRSAEVELGQVAFRLDTLGKYEGQGLTTGSHSTRSRANAIRDLYRIDVYLQAMQRCTPPIPNTINETFYLLASRLKDICLKYPNAVRMRRFDYGGENMSEDNPVPVEMQIDALDLLGREIESYVLYPLLMPNARGVVSKTIDIFFATPDDQQSRDGGSRSRGGDSRDDYTYYSQDGGRSYDDRSYDDRSYDSRSYDDGPYEDDGYEERSTLV